MTTYLTPFTKRTRAIELGNHLFKKQVLPYASINYEGRQITFDQDYADNLVKAFSEQAYDSVPFVMADEQNRHTMDPERARGEITALEASSDGLYAYIAPQDDDAAEFLRKNPKMGVSVRVVEEMMRTDGKSWPVALQHVLGTFDPQLTGMSPWEEVKGIAASKSGDEVIDLSGMSFAQASKSTRGVGMAKTEYSDDELVDLFKTFLENRNADEEDDEEVEPEEDENTEDEDDDEDDDDLADLDLDDLTTEELEEIAAYLSGEDVVDETPDNPARPGRSEVAASNQDSGKVLQLSNELKQQNSAMRQMRNELDAKNFETERADLMNKYGIPPRITDLAKPLLMGTSKSVELSNGTKADPGKIMRDVLMAVGEQARLLDMDGAIGSYDYDDSDEAGVADARADLIKRIREQTPGL